MPSLALRAAWPRPLICVVIRSEIARPAASSFALLIRKPEERRCNEVASWLPDVVRLRCAFSDITFVLMTSAMKMLLVFTCAEDARPRLSFQHWRCDVRRSAVQGLYRSAPSELEAFTLHRWKVRKRSR